MSAAFDRKNADGAGDVVDVQELYAQIGQLRVENEFLKKLQKGWGYKSANEIYTSWIEEFICSPAMRVAGCKTKQAVLQACR